MRKQLKLGVVCYPTFGGSGIVATEIGMAMAERGHKVHFMSYAVPYRLDRFRENVFFHEVEVITHPVFVYPPYSLALASKIVDVGTYEGLDILHVHYAVPHATSAFLAKQILGEKSPKVITTLHGTDITLVGNDRSYLPITRFSIIESDAVTTPSRYLRQATHDKLNIPSDVKIEVISNFVDTERYAPICSPEDCAKGKCFGVERPDKRVITHVSNFRAVKRIDDAVRAFNIIVKQVPSQLILVGDGPERSKVEALVRELGIKNDVTFLGKQETTHEILQHSDLFILPSENESFGLAALEAMSCGVPVVATRAQGIPEVVTHESVGLLSPVGDFEDMAKNAVRILSDHDLYCKMSAAARERAVNEFGQKKLIDQYEDYYFRVLAE